MVSKTHSLLFVLKGRDSVLGRSIDRGSSFVGQLAAILYLNLDILTFATEIFHSFYVLGIVWLGARFQVRLPAVSRFLGPLGCLPVDKRQGLLAFIFNVICTF